jgi:hypothetical protein
MALSLAIVAMALHTCFSPIYSMQNAFSNKIMPLLASLHSYEVLNTKSMVMKSFIQKCREKIVNKQCMS